MIEAGLAHFLRKGYRRTRIDEVAADAGVSAGSIYNYCTSKEALFDLCLDRAFGCSELPTVLPHDAHPTTNVIDQAWERFLSSTRSEVMVAVHEGRAAGSYTLVEIVEVLYDWLDANGKGIRLIERCASEWPELASYFYVSFRRRGVLGLAKVVEAETEAGRAIAAGPPEITARIIVEICSYFAMHRRKDPDDMHYDDHVVRASALEFIRLALRPSVPSTRTARPEGAHP
ncbi:MAG: TetR/AcrR family transcriptional regulator [Gemmatimonadetes bacterium]|nr:TetR/AcrR family transcriptional regulator [Gemmatimonadota bacterium]